MCGLLYTNDPEVERDRFQRALETMHHRGPDVAGCYADVAGQQLGHNRLSILDLDPRSNQPFVSHDGRYHMVYNGEIYNYRELIARHDLPVTTTGDTEVLLELYARLGERMLNELNGMWALVIYDTTTGEVF